MPVQEIKFHSLSSSVIALYLAFKEKKRYSCSNVPTALKVIPSQKMKAFPNETRTVSATG